jgi:hypothetical protein
MCKRTFRVLLVAAALLVARGETLGTRKPAESANLAATDPDALAELNDHSRAIYRQSRAEALAGSGPIVLVEGDDLVLKYGQQRLVARVTPAVYHVLKTVSHVPLAIHALLAGREQLGAQRLFDVQEYRQRVLAAGKELERAGLSDQQLQRQKKILAESEKFLASVHQTGKVAPQDLAAFYKLMRPEIDANLADAAAAQIDGLHRQMNLWKMRLSQKEWEQLTVVVMGSQMPRKDNLAVLYFARLLGVEGEGPRLIYAEALFDEAKALDLLGTHLTDRKIGAAFFDDPARMNRDLLADAARAHLKKLFNDQP